MMKDDMLVRLFSSDDPVIRYLAHTGIAGKPRSDPEIQKLQLEIKNAPQIRTMLENRLPDGRFPWHAYNKWKGAFWTLLLLVECGYPSGDLDLNPLRDQVLEYLLDLDRLKRIPEIDGRYRRCALQEATIVYAMLKLDLVDERIHQLVELLLKWQWPDGGWNCDKKPQASHSSFHETWIPLKAMHAYANYAGDSRVQESAERAAELFLSHRLFKHLSDDSVILEKFTKLAFPPYWHYDILAGLQAMQEIGKLSDLRCKDALDLLESKQLPNGGFPAEVKYYQVTDRDISGVSPVNWGPVGKTKVNEYVTVRAISVLRAAGRI